MVKVGREARPIDPPLCFECWHKQVERERREAEAAKILADLDAWVAGHLQRVGMSKREVKADLAKVPAIIKRALPKEPTKALLAGNTPAQGFGLGGNTDGGKTMAIAALLKAQVTAWAKREIPQRGDTRPDWFRWASWPDEVTWLRNNALEPSAKHRIEDLASCELLFLDDLGRERIKGSYAEDWAASQLDGIVNERYREERVTIWTTNVREEGLVALYGAAMLRRLTADNPLVWIENLGSAR